jgi:predicted HD superfamily hydrolase involved in NAD metabolism
VFMPDIEALKNKLKEKLTEEHYGHSLRTAKLAEEMAKVYGLDSQKAYIAGLLHDYAKSMPEDEMLDEAQALGIEINDVEEANPGLLHAGLSAKLVKKELGINDHEIISAIEKHTIGAVTMSDLDKIVYIADMVEPGRPYEILDGLRKIIFKDLDVAYKEAYIMTVEYLVKTRKLLHPQTLAVWNKLIMTTKL